VSQHRKKKKQIKKRELKPGIIHCYWSEITIVIIILVIAIIRYRLLDVPLERDEGEYAYMGQLILQGIPPYAEAYNMKFPGIYFVYALVLAIFGQTHTGIHFALLIINAATIFLIYLLGKYLFDSLTGTLSGISYGIISLTPYFHGLWANSEHYVVFFAVGGILLLIKAIHSPKLHPFFWSGILFGLSFTTKQHGILFTLFGIGYFIITYLKEGSHSLPNFSKKLGLFILGIIIPGGLFLITLAIGGVIDKFWFWTFEYASEYSSTCPLLKGVSLLRDNIFPRLLMSLSICLAAALGLTSPLWDEKVRSKWIFILGFFLASLIAVSIGFYFRPHYFILLFPSLALLSGIAIVALDRKISGFLPQPIKVGALLLAIIIIYSYPIFAQKKSLFQLTPSELCRKIYSRNPFPESLEIAKYFKQNTSINDRIAVIGSEPQIYFYAHRRAATGYLYTYALMESHPYALEMQKEMIQEVETAKPKYLVFVNVPTSWLIKSQSNPFVFKWLKSYPIKHYELKGVIDIISNTKTLYLWGEKAKRYKSRSNCNLYVFKRRK
jgi:4-amino-4-deoxy-L-arabinose transferase-like glycosyltransferase